MTATELRIGNIVNFGGVCEVVTIHSGGSLKVRPLKYSGTAYDTGISKIQPILLTEAWLLRFGFERQEGNLIFDLETGYLWKYAEDKLVRFMTSSLETILFIEYVHQLQNLYFSLTGQELQIQTKTP